MEKMQPRAWVDSATFSDGSKLRLGKDDIVLLVGPNNSGKSAALRAVRDKVAELTKQSPVISALTVAKEGTESELLSWMHQFTKFDPVSSPENRTYNLFGIGVHHSHVASWWPSAELRSLSRFFCHLLTAEERLAAASPVAAIPFQQPPERPIHFLQRDDRLEKRLSEQFRRAFGTDLIVHRTAGSYVPLLVGERPTPKPDQDRVSYEYIQELERLPALQSQGDGMRSFAGVLLEASVGRETILLVDEPEAFLHPPQARHLGRMLVAESSAQRQLFLATHSGDFLRGVLDANSEHVQVVRIRRDGAVNRVKQLDATRLRALWSDPLLRYSNVLDGIFHEGVVVTEGDADARFYAAIADALFADITGSQKPDVMFTHGGGKARLPMIVEALKAVDVPVKAITDFDILNDSHPLDALVAAAGGDWEKLKRDWSIVKASVDSKKPELTSAEIKQEITSILQANTSDYFPQSARRSIEKLLRRSSSWSVAKDVGKAFIPSGDATQACERLLKELRSLGIFVVEVGEIEGFAKSVGGHGPAWVVEAIQRDLKNDPEFENARKFVRELLAS